MEAATRKRKWWVIPLISIGIVYVAVLATVQGIKAYHTNQTEQEAKRWLKQAEEDAKPAWTEDDAVSWLERYDFEDIGAGEGTSSRTGRPDEHYFCAIGFRPFEKGGLIVKPSSIQLEFYFGLDHRFTRVKSKVWPFEPPRTKRKEAGQ